MLSTTELARFDARFGTLFAIDPLSIIKMNERHTATIDKVGVGGVIRIGGETFVVQKTATYVETNEKGTKDLDYAVTELVLLSLKTGETRYIEWSVDDEIEISFTERKLSTAELNRELRDLDGGTVDIDEEIDAIDGFRLGGQNYEYDDDYPCRYAASDGRSGQATMYEYGSDKIDWLTIEAWQNGDEWEYEGYLSKTISSNAIEVISVGK